jgi:hypothetical protein
LPITLTPPTRAKITREIFISVELAQSSAHRDSVRLLVAQTDGECVMDAKSASRFDGQIFGRAEN